MGPPSAAVTATAVRDFLAAVAREEPLLVSLGILLLFLVTLSAALRLLERSAGERLRRALSGADAVAILTHPNPDPDALAAALGVAHLAASVGASPHVQYPGQIRHQENRAFQTVLDVNCDPIDRASELAAGRVVLVDHNVPRGFAGADGVTPHAVIDHHPGDGVGAAFTDVREDYGACATIVAEYLEELGVVPGGDPDELGWRALPADVATGLLYGILSDTAHLTRGPTDAEFGASAYLYRGVDEDALDRIANPQVDAEVLDVRAAAIDARDVRAPLVVSDVGETSNVDAIPQAAEELLLLEGVSAVVVIGEADGAVRLSGRSRDDRIHMGNALRRAVSDIPEAGAGGHARMGGGTIPLARVVGDGAEASIDREALRERLFDVMAGER